MPLSPRLDEIRAELEAELRGSIEGLSDAEVLAALVAIERLGRVVDAARVRFAGEVGARSRPELGDDGLSRSQNFTSPVALVSTVTGASLRECRGRLALGLRLRGAVLLGGATGPDPFPAVSEALADGALAAETAAVITRHCAALGERGFPAAEVARSEQVLVDETTRAGLTADQAARLAVRLREHLDPDGTEPRDERHQQLRSLTFSQSSDGMLRGRFALTPEQGALWVGSLQALQSPRATGPRFATEDEYVARTLTADGRTPAQRNADTITELIARAAAAPEMPQLSGATTTVTVHATLSDLEAGRGVGWIDGVDEPVPASTVAQLRCHSPRTTVVIGEAGEVLHYGKTRRLFSPAQNRALAARDGGCIWPECSRPPSWCESHHVDEWRHPDHPPGRTDIDNGVLLCHFHHSHLHRSAWSIVMRGGVPHIVPPRWLDVAQTPIPTTRRRAGADPVRVAA